MAAEASEVLCLEALTNTTCIVAQATARERGLRGREDTLTQSRVGLGTEGRGEEQHGQGSHGDLHDAGQRAECERKQRPSRVGTRGLAAAASFRGLSPVFSI